MSESWAGRTPTTDQWREILEQHAAWRSGAGGQRADLRDADLRGADLRDAYLHRADLRGADLRDADLRGADLRGAYLHRADLRGADLRDADLRGAYLQGADLQGADLRGAYLQGADLARFQIVPDHGAFRAWKKLRGGVIAELEIPDGAGRVGGATGRKCRAERAICVALSEGTEAASLHNGEFVYRIGQMATPDVWNSDPLQECTGGIHFFITRAEAAEYEA